MTARLIGWRRGAMLSLAAMVLPSAAGAQAQTTALVGSVRDTAGRPIPGVEVRLQGGELLARTNDAGGFRVSAVPVGAATVNVRRIGFAPGTAQLNLRPGRVDSLVFALNALAFTLPGVTVADDYMAKSLRMLPGFWKRRSDGFGSFLTRDEIEARRAHDFVDLVRLVPSASVIYIQGRKSIRFKRGPATRDCPPQYWVDGVRIEQGSPDEFLPEDVEALELYAGPATMPPQFAPRMYANTCGAIIIWTRLPGA